MTDEQIIKYWNEIDSEIINEHGEEFDVYITMPVAKSTVDLINRQQAEIARLEKELTEYKLRLKMSECTVDEIKSEAIKEFAERLKKRRNLNQMCIAIVSKDGIDSLVKEMTEVQE